jgi:hypothetical protein
VFATVFAGFSAIAGYELAAGRPVNKWREMVRGFTYAPVSLARHLVTRPPQRRNWVG